MYSFQKNTFEVVFPFNGIDYYSSAYIRLKIVERIEEMFLNDEILEHHLGTCKE